MFVVVVVVAFDAFVAFVVLLLALYCLGLCAFCVFACRFGVVGVVWFACLLLWSGMPNVFFLLSSFQNYFEQDVELVLEVRIAEGPGEGIQWWRVWLVIEGLRIPIWTEATEWV